MLLKPVLVKGIALLFDLIIDEILTEKQLERAEQDKTDDEDDF